MIGGVCLAFAPIACIGPDRCWALDPSTALANYSRQSWVMENGLPQNSVTALMQSHDGFMWLGTEAGLVRFDGNTFQLFDRSALPGLPDNDISCLLEAPDGAMWIGTSAGLALWKDGTVKTFTVHEGLPSGGVLALRGSADGNLLVWTEQGLARQAGDRFEAVKNVDAFPRIALPPPAEYPGAMVFAEELPNDVLVVGDRSSLEFLQGKEHPHSLLHLRIGRELPGNRIQVVFADREGALWIGTSGGLARVAAGKMQTLPATDPLSTASVLALMEDREGDLWVGTETGGLHILRDQRFRIVDSREGLASDAVTAVVEDRAGALWVGTQGAGLSALTRGGSESISGPGNWAKNGPGMARTWTVRDGLMSDLILSLAAAPNGDLWVGTPDGLSRIRGGRVESFTSADGLPDDFVRSLLADSDGSLWIGTRRGLVHWMDVPGSAAQLHSQPKMAILTQADGLGSDTVGAMARDANGDLWVATLGGLSRLRGGAISNYTTANGLPTNVVTALLPLPGGELLIGTQDHGWDFWDGRGFSPPAAGELNQATIHAILEDAQGHLWFATGNGIARCDWSHASQRAGVPTASCIAFGTADGLRSRETAANSHPSATRSTDGRLWFATPKGLLEVDPAHFPVNLVEPPVAVEQFAVDDVDQPLQKAGSGLRVGAGHVHFQFDYAGLSFTAPLKVRYRYRLEGFDRNWTDAGTRRSAYYTNIPPGKYTFRVQAANNDGLWNAAGAAFSFELRPHFYQTLWFFALLLLAAGASIVLVIKGRLRTAQREFRAVLGERSRIAREIHDTLAQGYVGISVQLEMLAELLRQHKTDAAAQQLDKTRQYLRVGLADARQSIWALRTEEADETTLPVKMRRLVEAAGDSHLAAQFSVFGAYRSLAPGTEREVLRIAQEAVHNVKKHAGARRLSVHLKYEPAAIELEVSDDGKGGAPDQARTTQHGGFGLTGMRERAAAIRGALEVTSAAGEGTTVRLRAPAPVPVREGTGEQA